MKIDYVFDLALGFIFSLYFSFESIQRHVNIIDGCPTQMQYCKPQFQNVNNSIKVKMADWYFDDYIVHIPLHTSIEMVQSALHCALFLLNKYKNPHRQSLCLVEH